MNWDGGFYFGLTYLRLFNYFTSKVRNNFCNYKIYTTSDQQLAVKISGKNSKIWIHEKYSKIAHARIKINLHRLKYNSYDSHIFTEVSTYDYKHTVILPEFL